MPLRFRRSIKIAPGIRLNLSGGGVSTTIGGRGFRTTVGKRGTTTTASIPGTGLSWSSTSGAGRSSTRGRSASITRPEVRAVQMTVSIQLQDDGTVTFHAPDGSRLPPHLESQARKQARDTTLVKLYEEAATRNAVHRQLANTHSDTPPPAPPLAFVPDPFEEAEPTPPVAPIRRWYHAVLKSNWRRLEEAHRDAQRAYELARGEWLEQREAHERETTARRQRYELAQRGDLAATEAELEAMLPDLDWPRETSVSFEVEGSVVRLDIDLPEVEDLPRGEWSVLKGDERLVEKPLSETECRRRYARHVHGVIFRAVGETFARFPTIESVEASGYSQRLNKANGRVEDQYLIALRASRNAWLDMDFDQLAAVDPIEALGRLGVQRDMTKTGIFRPIAVAQS